MDLAFIDVAFAIGSSISCSVTVTGVTIYRRTLAVMLTRFVSTAVYVVTPYAPVSRLAGTRIVTLQDTVVTFYVILRWYFAVVSSMGNVVDLPLISCGSCIPFSILQLYRVYVATNFIVRVTDVNTFGAVLAVTIFANASKPEHA